MLISYADMAQMVEHILGKDEVTGSIPVISSIPLQKARVLFFIINFNKYGLICY